MSQVNDLDFNKIHLSSLAKLWSKTGVTNNRRYIATHETAMLFGSTLLKILPVFHCITGDDSVSSFRELVRSLRSVF